MAQNSRFEDDGTYAMGEFQSPEQRLKNIRNILSQLIEDLPNDPDLSEEIEELQKIQASLEEEINSREQAAPPSQE